MLGIIYVPETLTSLFTAGGFNNSTVVNMIM